MKVRVSEQLALASMRTLKMIDDYLAKQNQHELTTDGNGLMTWGEMRQHIECVLKYWEEELGG